ncbi:hypothetical protein, partial [Escherichia coli]|uniref:hypothetical protein n=1 Tax=Escherichia coli TaxID=562 RepID=UPI001EDB1E4B
GKTIASSFILVLGRFLKNAFAHLMSVFHWFKVIEFTARDESSRQKNNPALNSCTDAHASFA